MSKGFSLAELMVAVAIVGLLAAIGMPIYRDYLLKAQLQDVFADLELRKRFIEENHAKGVVYSTSSTFLYPI